jgi:GT2 family glycosyltransferase/glycosyltransferase involved in cell wall biosynthesis
MPPVAEIPEFAQPSATLILPVHSQPDLTAACVRAIAATTTVPYELVIVDDTATAAVKDVVSRITGATLITNDENLGYTRSLNRGASLARGEFLVFLNDDVVPQPGWLEAMVEAARSSDDIGVVVPMYLDPDGWLKEAGSIIWDDGAAENFGHGDTDLARSRYSYRRDVDYGSGACLVIRTDVFREIGGLDERFSPAYYEDVDLCFAVREAGMRVVYEPRAQVIHVEGATAGRDLTAGDKRYQVTNQRVFAEKWRHRLTEQRRRDGDPRLASRRSSGPQVLIADERVPTPDRDGGSSRMWSLIEAFQTLGCAVTFLPSSGDAAEPYASRLEARGVEVLRRPVDVDAELRALAPILDLAFLSRPLVAPRFTYILRQLAPDARIVYDTVDLHYVRELRQSLIEGAPVGRQVGAIRELELAMVRSCDATVVVTEDERDEILRSVPDADVRVIPTIATPASSIPGCHGRSGIVFLGNFMHPPNIDAARFLVDSVMPHVWERLGDVRLLLVGQDPPPSVQALAGPRVEVTGWVDDITAVFDAARIAVAPVRFGAGLKLKNVEAMAHGVPTVTTTVGAEGITGDGESLLVADEPPAIAEHILNLLRDDDLWQRTSDAAQTLVRARYGPAVVIPRLRELLPKALHDPGEQGAGSEA